MPIPFGNPQNAVLFPILYVLYTDNLTGVL